MAYDFPDAPATGELFTPAGGPSYQWDGAAWTLLATFGGGTAGAPLDSPHFTGDPTAPTPSATDDDTSLATTEFVNIAVTNAIAAMPSGGLADAPSDGIIYGRKDATWTEVVGQSYGNLFNYMFNATVGTPPASGTVRFNNTAQNLVTTIWINYTTNDSVAVNLKTYWLQKVKSGDTFYFQDKDQTTKWQLFKLNGPFVDGGTYAIMPVTWLAGGSNITAARIIVSREGSGVSDPVGEAPNDGKKYARQSLNWSAIPNITVGTTAPASPAINDVWIDTN